MTDTVQAKGDSGRRPNLVYVFADQLGYTRCGYAGDERARTPNVDRLAGRSVNFFNAVSNSPEKISYSQGVYEPDAQTDMAIDFLREAGTAGGPFALFLSYGTPHDPWVASNVPPESREMFADAGFPHPPNCCSTTRPTRTRWPTWPANSGTPKRWPAFARCSRPEWPP